MEDGRARNTSYQIRKFRFEKYFWRIGNRMSLTIVLDNIDDIVKVFTTTSGGGDGLLNFGLGTTKAFSNSARNVLREYIVE